MCFNFQLIRAAARAAWAGPTRRGRRHSGVPRGLARFDILSNTPPTSLYKLSYRTSQQVNLLPTVQLPSTMSSSRLIRRTRTLPIALSGTCFSSLKTDLDLGRPNKASGRERSRREPLYEFLFVADRWRAELVLRLDSCEAVCRKSCHGGWAGHELLAQATPFLNFGWTKE